MTQWVNQDIALTIYDGKSKSSDKYKSFIMAFVQVFSDSRSIMLVINNNNNYCGVMEEIYAVISWYKQIKHSYYQVQYVTQK